MKRIIFMGTPDFSVPVLQTLIRSEYEIVLVVTQPDRPKGRKRTLTPPPVKVEAEKHGLPVFQPERLKDNYEKIKALDADLIVTAAYGQLLPSALLEAPTFGCINVHASLLPELRGGAPIHYAILEGKTETGITIMYMAEKLDAGDILTQEKVIIEKTDDVSSLHDKLAKIGAALLDKTIPLLFSNQLTPVKQDEAKVTFAPNITREKEKIDWTQSNEDIYNHIRGLRPWPVAFTTFQGKRLKLWQGEPSEATYPQKRPGEIVEIIDKQAFVVVCGDNKGIRLTEIQPEGKSKMTAAEFINGDYIHIGMVLGD
ncbi:methionyl-tRNA formyltransferase [Virgibacillus sp. W0181]|uniref:methionyl-tRNA formyltransferase n=1 Tax=Virgibacillus sp. W0181 TaxID=3391581 RepID=UPI003F48593F